MINFQTAKALALDKLRDIESKGKVKLGLIENTVIEFEYGWIFCYQSQEFIKTNNFNEMISGNAPLLVDKYDGIVFVTGTGKDINAYMSIYSEFKRTWNS